MHTYFSVYRRIQCKRKKSDDGDGGGGDDYDGVVGDDGNRNSNSHSNNKVDRILFVLKRIQRKTQCAMQCYCTKEKIPLRKHIYIVVYLMV